MSVPLHLILAGSLLLALPLPTVANPALGVVSPPTVPAAAAIAEPTSPDRPVQVEPPPVRLVLRVGQRKVFAYRGDQLLASYPVAVGRRGWETPRGQFIVRSMIKDPTWKHPWNGRLVGPGPGNPLGDRWIGFWTDGRNEVGFHGTTNESLIGQAVSHGCVRMRNRDVRSLFELVQVGTPVAVTP